MIDEPALRKTLRLAVVLTGGVSLAVWMGGIARELNLLAVAGQDSDGRGNRPPRPGLSPLTAAVHDRYRKLCDTLGWDVEIDVLAGTSAGGINAVLLGLCNAIGGDLGGLRDLWLDEGAFDTLMRDPKLPAPPSLLQGDGVLMAGVKSAADTIRASARRDAVKQPTWLNVTTTLLRGEPSRFSDSYGTTVADSDHLGIFNFVTDDLLESGNDWALALAARSSASFPGAFEPAFLQGADLLDGQLEDILHPDMRPFIPLTDCHFVSDGGQLENQPIAPALQAVFDRPEADDPVRRVMMYVIPSSSTGVPPALPPSFDAPPGLIEALVADLQASRSQSIKSALDEITLHNTTASSRQDGWWHLARLGSVAADRGVNPLVDAASYAAYRRAVASDIAGPVVEELVTQLHGRGPVAAGSDASPAALELAATIALDPSLDPETVDPDGNLGRIPWTLPTSEHPDQLALLGQAALDDIRGILLNLRACGHMLVDPAKPSDRDRLVAAWQALIWQAEELGIRDRAPVTLSATVAMARTASPDGPVEPLAAAAAASRAWAAQLSGPIGEMTQAAVWSRLDDGLPPFVSLLGELLHAYPAWAGGLAYTQGKPRRDAAADVITDFVAFLSGSSLDRLVELHVLSRLLLPGGRDSSQPVEFVQVSADTRTSLDTRATATAKLTGMQFNHFGAFYRSSWRANDWMWGRLDGAGWIVHLLLSPGRLLDLSETSRDPDSYQQDLRRKLEEVAGCTAPPNAVMELNDLFNLQTPVPSSLPATSMWVAAALQRLIAAEELACVAKQLNAEHDDVPDEPAETTFLERYATSTIATPGATPDIAALSVSNDVDALLNLCKVSAETLSKQRESPLFVRTAIQAAAVGAASISTADAKPPAALKPVLLLAKQGTYAAYRIVISITKGRDLQTIAAAIAALVLGIALVTSSNRLIDLLGAVALAAGVTLALTVMQRALWAVAGLVVVLAAVALILAAFITRIRTWLFPRLEHNTLPWLSTHGVVWALIVLFVLLPPITTVAGFVQNRATPHNERRRALEQWTRHNNRVKEQTKIREKQSELDAIDIRDSLPPAPSDVARASLPPK